MYPPATYAAVPLLAKFPVLLQPLDNVADNVDLLSFEKVILSILLRRVSPPVAVFPEAKYPAVPLLALPDNANVASVNVAERVDFVSAGQVSLSIRETRAVSYPPP